MAAGADFRLRLVVRYIRVTVHARGAVGADLRAMNVVAGGALEMTLVLRVAGNPMKAGELPAFVAAAACRPRGNRPAVRLVTGGALPMPFWAPSQLFLVTARTLHHTGELVCCPFVARFTAGMAEISTS